MTSASALHLIAPHAGVNRRRLRVYATPGRTGDESQVRARAGAYRRHHRGDLRRGLPPARTQSTPGRTGGTITTPTPGNRRHDDRAKPAPGPTGDFDAGRRPGPGGITEETEHK